MSPAEAAQYLGVGRSTLSDWARRGDGPPRFQCGRVIRYRRCDLDAFIDKRITTV